MPTSLTRRLTVDGKHRTVTVPDDGEQLLYILRNQLGLKGPRFGCGVSQCGACTVLVDGQIRRSCVTPLRTVAEDASVETLDGLGDERHPHPLQRAFVEEQAGQCAYCINGMIMGALGWLRQLQASGRTAPPSEEEIAAFLSGEAPGSTQNYICRCGTHPRIVRAIRRAAERSHCRTPCETRRTTTGLPRRSRSVTSTRRSGRPR